MYYESLGCMLSTRDDNEFQLEAQGWNPIHDEKSYYKI